MTIHRITELVDTPKRDCIYDIIGHLDLRVCVDVGAAAGEVTRRIRLAGGRHTRVIAFEPYPGNHELFHRCTNGLENIELVIKAVTDRVGRATFTVPRVVEGNEEGWENQVGYSSVGFVSSGRGVRRRVLDWITAKPRGRTLTVDTTTIDTEFARQKIDFMKIDVQGGEAAVLQGADSMLRNGRIDILYVEWSGDPRVVALLTRHGYRLYDSTYVVGHKKAERARDDVQQFGRIGFEVLDELKLSTGEVAYELALTGEDVSPADAMAKVRKLGLSWIQTDLIATSDEAAPRFREAVRQYSSPSSFNADV